MKEKLEEIKKEVKGMRDYINDNVGTTRKEDVNSLEMFERLRISCNEIIVMIDKELFVINVENRD